MRDLIAAATSAARESVVVAHNYTFNEVRSPLLAPIRHPAPAPEAFAASRDFVDAAALRAACDREPWVPDRESPGSVRRPAVDRTHRSTRGSNAGLHRADNSPRASRRASPSNKGETRRTCRPRVGRRCRRRMKVLNSSRPMTRPLQICAATSGGVRMRVPSCDPMLRQHDRSSR